ISPAMRCQSAESHPRSVAIAARTAADGAWAARNARAVVRRLCCSSSRAKFMRSGAVDLLCRRRAAEDFADRASDLGRVEAGTLVDARSGAPAVGDGQLAA